MFVINFVKVTLKEKGVLIKNHIFYLLLMNIKGEKNNKIFTN